MGRDEREKVFKMAIDESNKEGEPVNFKIESSTSPREAIQDANYVIMTIEHGNRMETWKQDYYIPIRLGSKQIYGENGGPGGMFHTCRQVPPMLKVAEMMHDVAKDAFLLNYSNPLPRLTWAINRHMERQGVPGFAKKNIGLCHGVRSALAFVEGLFGGVLRKCDVVSAGLNHFYFIIKLVTKEELTIKPYGQFQAKKVPASHDLLVDLRERAPQMARDLEAPLIEELINTYGYLTYPGQSHPGEYIPWAISYAMNSKYDFKADTLHSKRVKQQMQDTIDGKSGNYWWLKQSGERAVPIIDGIEHDTGQNELAVNIQNDGCIERFPPDSVVEIPAIVNRSGAHGKQVGRLPRGIESLLLREVILQDMVVEAAVTGDYNVALQALCLDGTVPNPSIARAILDKMLDVQKQYLPQFHARR